MQLGKTLGVSRRPAPSNRAGRHGLAATRAAGGVHVDVAPLRENSGDPTAAWVARLMPGALAQALAEAGRSGAPVSIRIDYVIFGPSSGEGGPAGSSPDQIIGAVIVGGVARLLRAETWYSLSAAGSPSFQDQLRLSLARLGETGGGVILYLAQEGRGLGLGNKLRTYQLQEAGLDTVDANTVLGFDADERDYGVAARMLEMLGIRRIVLLTNNPTKVNDLAELGIEITGRLPIEAPVNSDNAHYLAAKAARAGHQLGHLIASLAERPNTATVPSKPPSPKREAPIPDSRSMDDRACAESSGSD
jgi:GTP cyclohydrolase II